MYSGVNLCDSSSISKHQQQTSQQQTVKMLINFMKLKCLVHQAQAPTATTVIAKAANQQSTLSKTTLNYK